MKNLFSLIKNRRNRKNDHFHSIKIVGGDRGSLKIEVDDKTITVQGELTASPKPKFYLYSNTLHYWNPPHDNVKLSDAERKELFDYLENSTKDSCAPIIVD